MRANERPASTLATRLALNPEELAESAGVGRARVFRAIKDQELTARKPGARTTIIEVDEAKRWIRSLPFRGQPDVVWQKYGRRRD